MRRAPHVNACEHFRGCAMNASNKHRGERSTWSWWYLLFLVQFVAVLWPPFYNRVEPALLGLPFFSWYQLACIVMAAAVTAFIYLVTEW
jgi:hypothetical protein